MPTRCGAYSALSEFGGPSDLDRAKARLYGDLRRRFPNAAAQALALKALNARLARYHFENRSTWLSSRPIGLVVDPSNMCQLACPGCVHSERSTSEWPNGTLSSGLLTDLIRSYGGPAIAVYFCNFGEPLLNLRTPALIAAAKKYLLWTALSTSLSVRRFDADAYVESGLDLMVLSVDGASQRTYERFRRNGDLGAVLCNIRKLVEAKRRLRRHKPVLSWNFLAFEHNAHEIAAAERLAHDLGVNQFRVVTPFDVFWDDPETHPAAVRPRLRRFDWTPAWSFSAAYADADAIGEAFESPWTNSCPEEAAAKPGHTCHWLYKNMVMDATGRVLSCCGAPPPVFTRFDGTGDPFNSASHQLARSYFGGRSASGPAQCVRCPWDQEKVNIGGAEIRRYFRGADPAYFDRRSLALLAGW